MHTRFHSLSRIFAFELLFASLLIFPPPVKGQGELASSLSAQQIAQVMASITEIDDVEISPDGAWVVYSVTHRLLETNEIKEEFLLQRVSNISSTPIKLPKRAEAVQWTPDGKSLSMLLTPGARRPSGFVLYDVRTQALKPILVNSHQDKNISSGKSPGKGVCIQGVSKSYEWSPRGSFVAFTAGIKNDIGINPRKGLLYEQVTAAGGNALCVLDVATGTITQLTSDSLRQDIKSFAWSPDESEIVIHTTAPGHDWITDSDLYIVERSSGKIRGLVTRPGMDAWPLWSPDGRWIAITTNYDDLSYNLGWPTIVPVGGGKVIAFPRDKTPIAAYLDGSWSPDSKAFIYSIGHDMTSRIVHADIATLNTTLLPAANSTVHLPHTDNYSFSKDGRWMAYTQESLTTPQELFVVSLDKERRSTGMPMQLTRLNSEFTLGKLVYTDTLSWRSPDGKFTIHSLLLAPASAWNSEWNNGRVRTPLPTLLFLNGGPSMVKRGFAADGFRGALLALAARGYAVLVPNTRGRGGYGVPFINGIRDGKSQGLLPYQDAVAGIDMLIERGIADSSRLGVLGHSYGGYLTAYTITQTNRFKAAVVHEGSGTGMLSFGFGNNKNSGRDLLNRDLAGIHNAFDPAEQTRVLAESPLANANRVRTPTLLQYAGIDRANMAGLPFLNALRRFNVPSALFVYDEGHVFNKPGSIVDDLTRTAEWLDYWVRGIPFPDSQRASEYLSVP